MMKKFIAFILTIILLLSTFSSCGKLLEIGKEAGKNFGEKFEDLINDGDSSVEDDEEPSLQDAKKLLETMMSDYNGKVTSNDYTVVGRLVIGDTTFDVTWTTNHKNISVKANSWTGSWTVDLPNVNDKEVEYKLTATIKAKNGKTVTAIFTPKLAVISNAGLETEFKADVEYTAYVKQMNLGYDLFVLNTTQNDENKFINTTMDPKEAAVFKFEIVEGGYKIYTMINGVKNYLHATATPRADKPDSFAKTIGYAETTDCVFTYDSALSLFKIKLNGVEFGVGTYATYETISLSDIKYFKTDNINVKEGQFPMNFMAKAHADTLQPSVKPGNTDPEAESTLSIADAIALGNTKVKNQYTKGRYYVEGTIKEIQNEQYGNLLITDGVNDLLIYGSYSADGKVMFGDLTVKPKVGDKIKVYGLIGKYNDAQIKEAWIVEGLPEGAVPSTPSTPSTPSDKAEVVTTPVAGTSYKFGLVQGNIDNKLLFINGEMKNTHYFATTENATDAIDVYVEAVTGGYNLYYMNGTTKTYINIKASGQYVNVKYETSDPTVYTFDATLKTFVTDITCENPDKTGTYCFGTYGTYETVSPTMTTKDNFPCQLYTVVAGEGGTETPENPETPETTTCTEHVDANGDFVCDTEACEVVLEPAADSTLTLPQANVLGTALKAADSTNKYTVIGTIVEVEDVSSGKMTIKDENDVTLYVYKVAGWADMAEKPVAGDVITLYGIIGSYHSVSQIENAEMKNLQHTHTYDVSNQGKCPCGAVDPDFLPSHECADGDDEDFICDNADCNVVIEPAADSVLTVKQALALAGLLGGNEYTEGKYYVTGVITGITNATDGRFSIKADGSTMDIYKAFSADGSKRFNAMDVVPVKGDTVTVYGIIGNYNGVHQMKEVWITNVVVHGDNHTYSDGVCTVCGALQPVAGQSTITCDFSTFTPGVQNADETLVVNDIVSVSTFNGGCHLTTQLRIFDSNSKNGNAVITSTKTIAGFVVNAGYKAATLEVYGSTDGGETWTLIENLTTEPSYADYAVAIDSSLGYNAIKLDAVGNQVRVQNFTLTVID